VPAKAVSILVAIAVVLLLATVIVVISAPLRSSRQPDPAAPPERDVLEAAREAKYREIRDAELDYRTGKLSREDYELIAAALRAEAIEILDRLATLDEAPGGRGSAP
jgi:type II secretory pathway component PulM